MNLLFIVIILILLSADWFVSSVRLTTLIKNAHLVPNMVAPQQLFSFRQAFDQY